MISSSDRNSNREGKSQYMCESNARYILQETLVFEARKFPVQLYSYQHVDKTNRNYNINNNNNNEAK